MIIENFEVATIKNVRVATLDVRDVDLAQLEQVDPQQALQQAGDVFMVAQRPLLTLSGLRERVSALMVLDGDRVVWGRKCF